MSELNVGGTGLDIFLNLSKMGANDFANGNCSGQFGIKHLKRCVITGIKMKRVFIQRVLCFSFWQARSPLSVFRVKLKRIGLETYRPR